MRKLNLKGYRSFIFQGIALLIVISMVGCGGFKVVRIPIPIPTFGLGGGEKKSGAKTATTTEDRDILVKGEAVGEASWYGAQHHRKQTASGERFNMYAMTAAHRTLPFDTKVRVTNLENGKSAVVRINDRGPFIPGRIIDVSREAARKLDFENQGIAKVKINVLN